MEEWHDFFLAAAGAAAVLAGLVFVGVSIKPHKPKQPLLQTLIIFLETCNEV